MCSIKKYIPMNTALPKKKKETQEIFRLEVDRNCPHPSQTVVISEWLTRRTVVDSRIHFPVPKQNQLVVEFQPPLKNISQNGNLRQIGVKINNIWNHHPENDHLRCKAVDAWGCREARIAVKNIDLSVVRDAFKTPSNRHFQTATTDFGAIFFVVWVVVSKKFIHFKVEIQRTRRSPHQLSKQIPQQLHPHQHLVDDWKVMKNKNLASICIHTRCAPAIYKWGDITPINTVMTPFTHLFSAI